MMGTGVLGEVDHCVPIVWSQPWLVWAKHSLALHGFMSRQHAIDFEDWRKHGRDNERHSLQTLSMLLENIEILNI